mgnify:CR=1 FL=1
MKIRRFEVEGRAIPNHVSKYIVFHDICLTLLCKFLQEILQLSLSPTSNRRIFISTLSFSWKSFVSFFDHIRRKHVISKWVYVYLFCTTSTYFPTNSVSWAMFRRWCLLPPVPDGRVVERGLRRPGLTRGKRRAPRRNAGLPRSDAGGRELLIV